MSKATGSFVVKLNALPFEGASSEMLGRRSIDKQFQGGLDAVSQGMMLSAGTPTRGSAGYVAIEQVTGVLDGRRGAFVLQHHATMNRGVPSLSIIVVPDSGTDELVGLSGTMGITITDGTHFYDFEYTLP
ncbi:MAG TPA: DUF3224 domain-containing protein [Vicinamibacterales bacterium]|nr:DUF3224 domain-containing protein [Vicinamibacterales bacterium]